MQLNLSHIVDQSGIPLASQSYDGNASDVRMNEDMLEFIAREIDLKRCILMADSMLCVMVTLTRMAAPGYSFVTKVPMNFDDKVRGDLIRSSLLGEMDESPSRPGRLRYETAYEIGASRPGSSPTSCPMRGGSRSITSAPGA